MRVLAVGRVARCDEDNPGDDFALGVDDAGGGTHLGFDALFLYRGPCGQYSREFFCCGGTPTGLGLRSEERRDEGREKKDEGKLHGGNLIIFTS